MCSRFFVEKVRGPKHNVDRGLVDRIPRDPRLGQRTNGLPHGNEAGHPPVQYGTCPDPNSFSNLIAGAQASFERSKERSQP